MKINRFAFGSATVLSLAGCSAFMPPHSNSYDVSDEKVIIELISYDQVVCANNIISISGTETGISCVSDKYDKSGNKIMAGPLVVTPLVATAVTYVASAAFDYAVEEIEQEASLYEAQYGKEMPADNFWSYVSTPACVNEGEKGCLKYKYSSSYKPNYWGMRIKRTTEKNDDPAFDIILSFEKSSDGQLFKVVPEQLKITRSKAKVLSDETITYFNPLTWFPKLFNTAGHKLNVNVDIKMDGYWRGSDQMLHSSSLAFLSIPVNGYDIESNPTLDKDDLGGATGWMLTPPVSMMPDGSRPAACQDPDKECSNKSGNFAVSVTITERDPSNAKKYIEKASTYIKENKASAVDAINGTINK